MLRGPRKASAPHRESFPLLLGLRMGRKFQIWGCRGEETLPILFSGSFATRMSAGCLIPDCRLRVGKGSGGMAQWVECLHVKHRGLTWDPSHSRKTQVRQLPPAFILPWGGRDRQVPELAVRQPSRSDELRVLKGKSRKTASTRLWPPHSAYANRHSQKEAGRKASSGVKE